PEVAHDEPDPARVPGAAPGQGGGVKVRADADGRAPRRARSNAEHVEAVMFMRAVRGAEADWPELRWLFAVPNGGWRAKRTAAAMKAEGAQAGVPDYLLPLARGGYAGLAIELKTATGRVSPEQRAWLAHLAAQGWQAVVARGWEQ